jgi:hypothetical protein
VPLVTAARPSRPLEVEKAAPGERRFARKVLRALSELQDFDLVAFADTLSTSGEAQALALVPFEAFEEALRETGGEYEAMLVDNARKEAARLKLTFDATNPYVFQQVATRTAELVREVSDSTRQAIRNVIARAALLGGHPYDVARAIRPTIGLHDRWAGAVFNFRTNLLESGTPAELADKRAEQYRERLLGKRSRLIARTETLKAQNHGRQASWADALARGLIGRDARKEFVASGSACHHCSDLDGTSVGVFETFASGLGAVDQPPVHPACRCTTILLPGS